MDCALSIRLGLGVCGWSESSGATLPRGTNMAQRQTLPVLPLRGTVIFPGLTAPIAAGRPGTLRALEAAHQRERLVFAAAHRHNTAEPTPDILYSMGVIARIRQIQRGLGGVQLLLHS